MMKQWLVVMAVAICMPLSLAGASPSKKPKAVTTLINSKWEATPFMLDIAEYLAEENKDSLWSFVDAISELSPPLSSLGTDKAVYDKSISEASRFLSLTQVQLLKLALSLHIYAPKIEMYSQMAKENGVVAKGCPAVAYIAGKLLCHPPEAHKVIQENLGGSHPGAETFRVDHHYPGSENRSMVVVLYGEIGSPEFTEFHKVLKTQAMDGNIDYVLRHYVKERPNRMVRLSGYGVELQMKSTEYKAQDDTQVKGGEDGEGSQEDKEDEEIEGFNFNKLKTLYPDKVENLEKFRQALLESTNEMAPLKAWQFQELSLQAAERIMSSPKEEALHVLTHIAQNFPLQARTLVRTVVNSELKREMKHNQDLFATSLNLQPQDTAIFVNGMFFDLDVVDVISLLEIVRQEHRLMNGLHSVGISDKRMNALMGLDLSGQGGNSEYGIDIRDSAVFWANDIENDKAYKRWPGSLRDLLRPTFPGMLRSIRRNLFNLVLIADPSKRESFPVIKLAESFIHHQSPLHIGIVLATTSDVKATGFTDASVAMLNGYNYAVENGSPSDGLSFLTDVYAAIKTEARDVKVEDVHRKLKSKYKGVDLSDVFGEDSDYNTGRKLAHDFVERSGLRTLPQALLNGIQISDKTLSADEFEEAVVSEIMSQTPIFQKAVYKGELRDSDNVLDFIMDRPNIMPRLNERILNSENNRHVDLSQTVTSVEESISPDVFSSLGSSDQTALMVSTLRYFLPRKQQKVHFLTNWIVGDLSCGNSRKLLHGGLTQMKSSGSVRVAFIVNPKKKAANNRLNKLVLAALKVLPAEQATLFTMKLLEEEDQALAIEKKEKKLADLKLSGIDVAAVEAAAETAQTKASIARHVSYAERTLGLGAGDSAVISNGRIIGPLDDGEMFTTDDFSLLERHSYSTHVEKIKSALMPTQALGIFEDDDSDDSAREINSDVAMRVISLLVSHPQSRARFEIPTFTSDHSVIDLPAQRPTEPAMRIDVIVDPVSRGAQRVGPILIALQSTLNCHIRVFLNSVEKNSDMPLKSFYRFVLEPELQFTSDGQLTAGPIARFTNLPHAPLLTQNLQVPENWLVESVSSPYDLDNIRLEDVVGNVHSEYELEYLLLEGHCFEAMTGNPPRGLQITLGTENQPVKVDTIVMANLGYFQLKANPGAWILRLRQGRSSDLFDIVSHDGSDTPPNSTDIKVVISSFRSHVLKLRVQKKPDKINSDLLSEDDDDPIANNPGLWNSITSTFGSKPGEVEEQEEKLNIFSVASGHLYERFLRIMMLSVLKNTKTPVKFWFLKNYLSPRFKDFLPHMAKEYGFEFELVQYKWPRWLHQQTEKQRIIWGYKILFLDVLFPLDIKKIIFVDADQVVRADLKELRDLDLNGAPYGYTPFCDSRTEMDGFRFWNQGYWRSHLQGRRYHISALYVVDLKRFRRIAAGDRLRGQYQALSQDPNSLSNLDQDLPNNMIHQVAIKSLPQEWLWCETWCDDQSKKQAKTIDLCNNPLTKEAKLTAAMRILPEWKGYDDAIKKLQEKIQSEALDTHAEFSHNQSGAQSEHVESHTEL